MSHIKAVDDTVPSLFADDVLSGKLQQQVISYKTSQYGTAGIGSSACGLAALNCARVFFRLYKAAMNEDGSGGGLIHAVAHPETVKEIVSICSTWTSSEHLEVEDLLRLPLFKNAFTLMRTHYGVSRYSDFLGLLNLNFNGMSATNFEKNSVSAFVITRPPEILVCLKISSSHDFADNLLTAPCDMYMIFDSHNRPAHPSGSGFIVSSSASATARYLDQLFALDAKVLSDPTIKWQAELMKQFSAHVLLPNMLPSDTRTLEATLMDASKMILELKAKIADMEEQQSYLTVENEEMLARIGAFEESHILSDVKGKKKAAGHPNECRSTSERSDGLRLCQAFQEHNSASLAASLQANYDNEDRILARQREQLSKSHASFQCKICLEEFFLDNMAQFPECKHSFCRTCLRSHISSSLEQRRYPILCPGCVADRSQSPVELYSEFFENLGLSEPEFAIFQELQLSAHSIALHCRKCRETMFVDRSEYQSSKIIVCPLPRCNNVWCKDCQQTIEIGGPQHSCDGSTELQYLMTQRGWRHCPGCQTPIQKDAGCNHMTCLSPGCNTHFCYVCGEHIIQSVVQRDIRNAISVHYRRCRLL